MLWQDLGKVIAMFHGCYILQHQSPFWKKELLATILNMRRFSSAKTNKNIESQALPA